MTQHNRPSRTGTLPVRGGTYDANWMKQQRQPLLDTPSVLTNSADLTLVNGAPGALATFSWQPVSSPIYDRYNMVGPVATTSIRIPWDGIYDILGSLLIRSITTVFQVETLLQSAPTSDSGFGAPVFASVVNPPGSFNVRSFLSYERTGIGLSPRVAILHPALEFHANDLIQYQAQTFSTANISVNVEQFCVRWVAPIPNNMINI